MSSGTDSADTTLLCVTAVQVCLTLRTYLRSFFGPGKYDECGYFVDLSMARMVHSFLDWVTYPSKGGLLSGHMDVIECGTVSDSGRHLYTASSDGCIIQWDLTLNNKERHWWLDSSVSSLDCRRGLLASATQRGKIEIWNDPDCTLIKTFETVESDHSSNITFSPNGTYLATCSSNKNICLWSVKKGVCLRSFIGHSSMVSSLCFSDKSTLISCSFDGCIKMWNTRNGDCIKDIGSDKTMSLNLISISLNCDRTLLAAVAIGYILLFSYPKCDLLCIHSEDEYGYRVAVWHPSDPAVFASHTGDGVAQILQIKEDHSGVKELVDLIEEPDGQSAGFLCFTKDGTRIIFNEVEENEEESQWVKIVNWA